MNAKHIETQRLVERLGDFVKDFRTQIRSRPLSQATLARWSGYSRVTLSGVERASGQQAAPNPHLDLLVGIAKAFGVRLSDLLALAETDGYPVPPETIARLADALNVSEDVIGRSISRVGYSSDCHEGDAPCGAEHGAPKLTLRESPRLDPDPDRLSDSSSSGDEEASLLGAIEEIGKLTSELARFMGATSDRIRHIAALASPRTEASSIGISRRQGGGAP